MTTLQIAKDGYHLSTFYFPGSMYSAPPPHAAWLAELSVLTGPPPDTFHVINALFRLAKVVQK